MESILSTIGTYWIHFLCSIVSALLIKTYHGIIKKMEKEEKENQAMKIALINLLKERISRNHSYYMSIGYCPVDALGTIEMIYNQLDELEHSETYENLIKELRIMPHYPVDENGKIIKDKVMVY